jgi:ParB family chromosome partitioning protein
MNQSLQGGNELPEAPLERNSQDDYVTRDLQLSLLGSIDTVHAHGVLRSLDPAKLFDSTRCRIETMDQVDLDELIADIKEAGKNEIPILIHTKRDGTLEVIYGARRVQACRQLGIPVLAHCIDHEVDALAAFRLQEVENRSRSTVSAYESARRYAKALSDGLFPSQRKLAEFVGISQPWISTVLPLADLPLAVVRAFDHLNDLQPDHAGELQAALAEDEKGLLLRANQYAAMRSAKKRRSAKETMRYLLGNKDATDEEWLPLDHCGREVGRWKCNKKDETIVRIPRKLNFDEISAIAKVADAITVMDADVMAMGDK